MIRTVTTAVATAWLLAFSPTLAQPSPSAPPPSLEALETRQASHWHVFELVRLVRALERLETHPTLAPKADQADAFRAELARLGAADTLAVADAQAAYEALTALFTPAQSRWHRALSEEQEQLMARRLPQVRTVTKPTIHMFTVPGYLALLRRFTQDPTLNPFCEAPNAAVLEGLLLAFGAG